MLSPKSNWYDAIGVASLSVEPDAFALTTNGATPEVGEITNPATGGPSTTTGVELEARLFDPLVSVTVTDIV